MSLIIFTGLDRVLLPIQNRNYYDQVLQTLRELQGKEVPLISVTANTRAEVEKLNKIIGLNDPFIVEHGSGIFIAKSDRRFAVSEVDQTENQEKYYLKQLGCNYTEARAALKAVQEDINKILRGFGDLDEADVASLTGLSLTAARYAKAKEFSESFETPVRIPIAKIQAVAEEYGFRILSGDRNLSHIVGQGASRAKAVQWLKQNYQPAILEEKIVTVGLGSSSQDWEMLKSVDVPIVIPTSEGVPPSLADRGWKVASAIGSQGWVKSVAEICDRYLQ